MAKRFFNTNRIEEDWYLTLSCKHRELLRYCESKCDQAGVFNFNSKIASGYIGEKVDEKDISFLPIKKLDNGRFWIVDFISEQNGELSKSCPAHNPIFKSIKENSLNTLLDTLSNTLFNRVQGIDIDKGIEKGIGIEIEIGKEIEIESAKIFFPFQSEAFTKSWDCWKKFKRDQFKFTYKSEQSEQLALNELFKLSGGIESNALEIINQSMANGWKGLFELKNRQDQKPVTKKYVNADGTENKW